MMTSDHLPGHPEALRSQAEAWLLRLTSGVATQADAVALKRWCQQSNAHAAAFAEVNLLWDRSHVAAQNIAQAGQSSVVAQPLPMRSGLGRRAFLGGAMAASAAAAIVANPPLGLWPSLPELTADHRTGTGEQRRIAVADNISVNLNVRTSLSVRPNVGGDTIELITGEAAIEAGVSEAKPFMVIAAAGRTIASRANFNIRHDDAAVCVTCLDGIVRVEYGEQVVSLRQQQQVLYSDRGLERIVTIDPDVVRAWQDGMLVFRNKPLDQVIDEINRYRSGKIVLMNARLGRRLVEASFRLDRIDDVITLVRDVYDARVTRLPGSIVVLS